MKKNKTIKCLECQKMLNLSIQVEDKIFEQKNRFFCPNCGNEFIFNIDGKSFLELSGTYNIINNLGFEEAKNPLNLIYPTIYGSEYIPIKENTEYNLQPLYFSEDVFKYTLSKEKNMIKNDSFLTIKEYYNISVEEVRNIKHMCKKYKTNHREIKKILSKLITNKKRNILSNKKIKEINIKLGINYHEKEEEFLKKNIYFIFHLNKLCNMKFGEDINDYSFEDIYFEELLKLYENMFEYLMKEQIYFHYNFNIDNNILEKHIKDFNSNPGAKARTFKNNMKEICNVDKYISLRNMIKHDDYKILYKEKLIRDNLKKQDYTFPYVRELILDMYDNIINYL